MSEIRRYPKKMNENRGHWGFMGMGFGNNSFE